MASLTFSSLNVNGLRNPTKRFSLNRFLSSSKVHVVGLQETHWSTEVEARQWSKDFPSYDIYWSLGSSKQNGVSILVDRSLRALVRRTANDDDGRFLALSVSLGDVEYSVACVYCPYSSVDRVRFFRRVLEPMLDENHLIVLGDFNTVLDPALDRLNVSRPRPDPAARLLSSLVTGYSLCDVYRSLCPNERAFTWRRHSNRSTQMCRLDLILVSDDLASSAISVWLRPWQWSDHLLLSASFRGPEVCLRGPGYWHLNLAVLGDGDYSDRVEEFWKSWREEKPRFSSLCVVGRRQVSRS